jgi:hypothetical protein
MMTQSPRWRPIALSGKHRKAMDRVGGAELMLPWPPGLPSGPPVTDTREATPAEHRAAEEIVGPACRAADLVPIRSTVAILRRPALAPPSVIWQPGVTMQHLVVLIIGRRWVHASTQRQPGICWYAGGAIEGAD